MGLELKWRRSRPSAGDLNAVIDANARLITKAGDRPRRDLAEYRANIRPGSTR